MSDFVTIITQDGTRITTPRRRPAPITGPEKRTGATPPADGHAGSDPVPPSNTPDPRDSASELPVGVIPARRSDLASSNAGSSPPSGVSSPTAGAPAPAFLGAGTREARDQAAGLARWMRCAGFSIEATAQCLKLHVTTVKRYTRGHKDPYNKLAYLGIENGILCSPFRGPAGQRGRMIANGRRALAAYRKSRGQG